MLLAVVGQRCQLHLLMSFRESNEEGWTLLMCGFKHHVMMMLLMLLWCKCRCRCCCCCCCRCRCCCCRCCRCCRCCCCCCCWGCWWRRLCYQPCFTFAYPQPRHLQAEHHPSSIEKRSLCSQTSTSDPKKIPWQKIWWKLQQNHRNSLGISWHLREDFLTKRMLQSRPCWHFGSPPWPFS